MSVCVRAESIIKTSAAAPTEGAATLSQAAVAAVAKKAEVAGEDSLSPFTSDAEDAKPRKSPHPDPLPQPFKSSLLNRPPRL